MVSQDIVERVKSYMRHQATKPHDAILDIVATSQGRYLDVVGGLDDDVAAKKPAPDEWSVRELTRHVIQAQAGVADIVQHASRGQRPPPGDRPRAAGTMMDDDGRPFAAYVAELRDVNARMLEAIRALPDAPDTSLMLPHPFFGDLNCLEWAVFQRVHDEDHVQHAQKILAAVS
jgi:hypothetical protein